MKIDRTSLVLSPEEASVSIEMEKIILQLTKECETLNFTDINPLGKVHILHWADILDKFDEILENVTLHQKGEEPLKYTRDNILDVLKTTTFLLREMIIYSEHYNSFDRIEHLVLHSDIEIVSCTLQLVLPFTQPRDITFGSALQAMAFPLHIQPISLTYMLLENIPEDIIFRGSSLCFEYLPEKGEKISIFIPELYKLSNTPDEILKTLIVKYNIPEVFHFPLLFRIRYAKEFPNNKLRNLYAIVQLYALAFGNLQNVKKMNTTLEYTAKQLFQILPHPDISIEHKIHVLRCFSRLDDSRMIQYIIKRGCTPDGIIPSMLRELIASCSSEFCNSDNVELLLISLLANIYSYTFHDIKGQLISSGVINLLIYLLGSNNHKIFCLSLEIVVSSMKVSTKVLHYLISNGLDKLLYQASEKGKKIFLWVNNAKHSNLTISHSKHTSDQQVITTLIECLSTFLSHSGRSTRNNNLVGKYLQKGINSLLCPILQNPSKFYFKLINSALGLISDMIQTEPENYYLIEEAGLCSNAIECIKQYENLSIRGFSTSCNVILHISLNANGRKEIIKTNTLEYLSNILLIDDNGEKHSALDATAKVSNMLCELYTHYENDYKTIIIDNCISIVEKFSNKRKKEKEEIKPKLSLKDQESRFFTPAVEISIAKFTLFSSNIHSGISQGFSNEQMSIWISSAIDIISSYFPENINQLDITFLRFLSNLQASNIKIVLKEFVKNIKNRMLKIFPNGFLNIKLDPLNKDMVSTCIIMNYFVGYLETVRSTLSRNLETIKEYLESDECIEVISLLFDMGRCISWHSSYQDCLSLKHKWELKNNPSYKPPEIQPTLSHRKRDNDIKKFSFDCFYLKRFYFKAPFIIDKIYFFTDKPKTNRSLLLKWAENNHFYNEYNINSNLILIQYLFRSISGVYKYLRVTKHDLSNTDKKIQILTSNGFINLFLNYTYNTLFSEDSYSYQILSNINHELRDIYQNLVANTIVKYNKLCEILITSYKKLDKILTQPKYTIQIDKIIENMKPFWLKQKLLNFPSNVIQSFLELYQIIYNNNNKISQYGPIYDALIINSNDDDSANSILHNNNSNINIKSNNLDNNDKNDKDNENLDSLYSILESLLDNKHFTADNFLGILKPKTTKIQSKIISYIISITESLDDTMLNNIRTSNLFKCLFACSYDSQLYRDQIINSSLYLKLLSLCNNEISNPTISSCIWISTGLNLISSFLILPKHINNIKTIKICLLTNDQCKEWLDISLKLLSNDIYSSSTDVIISIINLLSKILINRELVPHFLANDGLSILFSNKIQSNKNFSVITSIQCVLRHILETSASLQIAIENEICFLLKNTNVSFQPMDFLKVFAHLVLRDKDIFFKAAFNCCNFLFGKFQPYHVEEAEKDSPIKVITRRVKLPYKNSNQLIEVIEFLIKQLLKYSDNNDNNNNDTNDTNNNNNNNDSKNKDNNKMEIDNNNKENNTTKVNDKKDNSDNMVSISSQNNTLVLLRDLITNFPSCSQIILDYNVTYNSNTVSFVYYLLRETLCFPEISLTSWCAKESDTCLHGARLIVVLWGTKEGRKKILIEISNILNEINKSKLSKERNNILLDTKELCLVYSLSELLGILLKLRKSKEPSKVLANLCVDSDSLNNLISVLKLINLDLQRNTLVIESIIRSMELLSHLIQKYYAYEPKSNIPSLSILNTVESNNNNNNNDNDNNNNRDNVSRFPIGLRNESQLDLLSYMESVTNIENNDNEDEIQSDDDDENGEFSIRITNMNDNDDSIMNDEEEDDDDEEDDEEDDDDNIQDDDDDDDDDDNGSHIVFQETDTDENPWDEGIIPQFFFGGGASNEDRNRIPFSDHLRNMIRRRIRMQQERLNNTSPRGCPLKNVGRPESNMIQIVPTVQHAIRTVFGQSIPQFLFKRWSRWIDCDCIYSKSILEYSQGLHDSFMAMYSSNTGSPTVSLNSSRPIVREPPRKNRVLHSLRGTRRQEILEALQNNRDTTISINDNNDNNTRSPFELSYGENSITISPISNNNNESSNNNNTDNNTDNNADNNNTDNSASISVRTPVVDVRTPVSIDMDVLNELPADIRAEILENRNTVEHMMQRPTAPPGISQDDFNALPPEIQLELVSQNQRVENNNINVNNIQNENTSITRIGFSPPHNSDVFTFRQNPLFRSNLQVPPNYMPRTTSISFRPSPLLRRRHGIERISSVLAKKAIDYNGPPLIHDDSLIFIVRSLYYSKPIPIYRLCRKLCLQEQTRSSLCTILLYILCSKRSNYYQFNTNNVNNNIINLIENINIPYADSITFSPINDPCHPVIGLSENTIHYISLQSGSAEIVVNRILPILMSLILSNPYAITKYMFSKISINYPGISEYKNNDIIPFTLLLGLLKNENSVTFREVFGVVCCIFVSLTKNFKNINKQQNSIDNNDNNDNNDDNDEIMADIPLIQEQVNNVTDIPMEDSCVEEILIQQNNNNNNTDNNNNNNNNEIKNKDIECPKLENSDLQLLVKTLKYKNCLSTSLDNIVKVIYQLCSNEDNKYIVNNELQESLIIECEKEIIFLNDNINQSKQYEKEKQISLFLSARPSPYSQSLLRIVKCCSKVINNQWNNKVLEKLNLLWNTLYKYLGIIQGLFSIDQDTELLSISVFISFKNIIEAFFIVHKLLWPTEEKANEIENAKDDKKIEFAKENSIYGFISSFHVTLNIILKQSSNLLKGPLSKMTLFPSFLSFGIKRKYLRKQLHNDKSQRQRNIKIRIRRNNLFEDSFHHIKKLDCETLKQKFAIQFEGEEGVDAGGLLKEWYLELSKQIFNPNYALFIHTANNTFQPNMNSSINFHHLEFFKFCGRVIGKAIFDGALMDVHFTRSFYKHILSKKINWKDIEDIDPEFYKNLQWLLSNDVSDLDLSFTTESNSFGNIQSVDLVENGSKIQVTQENKQEYVQSIANYKMTSVIQQQINSFKEGFHELIPHKLVSIFNELELELLISGLPTIDVMDLKRNTEYRGYTVDSPIIRYFWNIISKFEDSEKALLLQFVTGSSQVPLDGFAALQGMNGAQKFRIVKGENTDRLPTAHTCFNQLDLPPYKTEEELELKLLTAIKETTGFGFA